MAFSFFPQKLNLSDTPFNFQHWETLFRFKAKYPFEIVTENYLIKTATQFKELYNAFRLRYESFSPTGPALFRIDIDEYDFLCDHIVIIERKSQKVVGTYRIRCSRDINQFYSQQEFFMDKFLATKDTKIELGRACIAPEYRNGSVIDLLWKGIAMYVRLTNSRYLFGCSSVKTTDQKTAQHLYNMLADQGHIGQEYDIHPIDPYCLEIDAEQHQHIKVEYDRDDKRMLPPLLRSYLNGGALVYGTPALDLDFQCIDFLTIMDMKNINRILTRRYFS